MYTLADLKSELRQRIFPQGEASNLIAAHDAMFVEALMDLQQYVPCLQINNASIIPFCDTLFKCGYTAFDAPRGHIRRVYTVDKVNQTTGIEDDLVPIDWCSWVDYRQVEYSDLDRYVSASINGSAPFNFWSWCGVTSQLSSLIDFPGCWNGKYRFPPPDDAGLSKAPPLPLGHHYAQTSTDAPDGSATQTNDNGVRAQYGLWALKGGMIYLAPWIQSTEQIVVEWDGLKRTWADTDRVDDDPTFKKAVEMYVRYQCAAFFDHDYDQADKSEKEYNIRRADLMHECREETRIRHQGEAAGMDGAGVGRGGSQILPTFFNEEQQATAQCPSNQTGNPVTQIVAAGQVSSTVSVADANAKAKSLALQLAGQQLDCTDKPVTYLNTPQTYTAQCVGGTGNPVTVTIPAGQFTSTVSQQDADDQALSEATVEALAQLSCSFLNDEQTYTATCPGGSSGTPVTVTIPAGAYSSTVSKQDANAQALAAAQTQAIAAIVCTGSPPKYTNTPQSCSVGYMCLLLRPPRTITATAQVLAGKFSSLISQADANNQAHQYACTVASQQAFQTCQQLGGNRG